MLRPSVQSDIELVRANPLDDSVKSYPAMTKIGDCVTGSHHGIIWGVGGMVSHCEGFGEFWLMLTKDCKEDFSGLKILHEIQGFVDDRIRENELHRAQAVVRVSNSQAIKMIEFLGFEMEGIMIQYLPDRADAFMYAKIRGKL